MASADKEDWPQWPTTVKNLHSMEDLDNKGPLSIGDCLSFRIMEDGDRVQKIRIPSKGINYIPYLGEMKLVGMTPRQAADKIKAALEKGHYFKKATVLIAVEYLPPRGYFTVRGEVKRHGRYDIGMFEVPTLVEAISRTGGFTDDADRDRIHLHTKASKDNSWSKDHDFLLKYNDLIDPKSVWHDYRILPDADIVVDKKGSATNSDAGVKMPIRAAGASGKENSSGVTFTNGTRLNTLTPQPHDGKSTSTGATSVNSSALTGPTTLPGQDTLTSTHSSEGKPADEGTFTFAPTQDGGILKINGGTLTFSGTDGKDLVGTGTIKFAQKNDAAESTLTQAGEPVKIKSPAQAKAEKIILQRVFFAGATLNEVLTFFRTKSIDLDPEKKGVTIESHASPQAQAARISLDLSNVPLDQALRYTASLANLGLKFKGDTIVLEGLAKGELEKIIQGGDKGHPSAKPQKEADRTTLVK
jgi:polysaccharide export outer membrane protein